MHLIYRVTNLLNGKTYIGQRTYYNEPTMENYYGGGIEIRRAVKKYGRKNFKREILYSRIRDQETADSMEIWAIEKYKPEYNIAKGGKVFEITTEMRNKISDSLKNYYKMFGSPTKGKHPSEETKRKISESQKKRFSNINERSRTSELTKKAMKDKKAGARISLSLKEYYKRTGKKPITTKGKKWYNNGEISGFFFEGSQPEGWDIGRIYTRRK